MRVRLSKLLLAATYSLFALLSYNTSSYSYQNEGSYKENELESQYEDFYKDEPEVDFYNEPEEQKPDLDETKISSQTETSFAKDEVAKEMELPKKREDDQVESQAPNSMEIPEFENGLENESQTSKAGYDAMDFYANPTQDINDIPNMAPPLPGAEPREMKDIPTELDKLEIDDIEEIDAKELESFSIEEPLNEVEGETSESQEATILEKSDNKANQKEAEAKFHENTKIKICSNKDEFSLSVANLVCLYINHDNRKENVFCSVEQMPSSDKCGESLEEGSSDFAILESDIAEGYSQTGITKVTDLYDKVLTFVVNDSEGKISLKDTFSKNIVIPQKGSSGNNIIRAIVNDDKVIKKWEENGSLDNNSFHKLCSDSSISGLVSLTQHPNKELYKYSQRCSLKLIYLPINAKLNNYKLATIPGDVYMNNSEDTPSIGVTTSLYSGAGVSPNTRLAVYNNVKSHKSLQMLHPAINNID